MLDNEASSFLFRAFINNLFIIGKVKNFGAKKDVSTIEFHV